MPVLRTSAHVRVPATSANLGPGFDALGLALTLYDDVTASPADRPLISVAGEGAATVPLDPTHLVYRCAIRALAELGVEDVALELTCHNRIPHGRGLGSSSAAIVGGLAVGRALLDGGEEVLDDHAVFALAAEIEGHPDNVAPAVFGGLTVAYAVPGGFRAVSAPLSDGVLPVAFIPPTPLTTAVARGLLPAAVPHADAAFNVGRTALVLLALDGRPDLLLEATEDRLHQGYRAAAMPDSAGLIARLRAGGIAATVSGAGPTVLALLAPGAEVPADLTPDGWRFEVLGVDAAGVHSVPLG